MINCFECVRRYVKKIAVLGVLVICEQWLQYYDIKLTSGYFAIFRWLVTPLWHMRSSAVLTLCNITWRCIAKRHGRSVLRNLTHHEVQGGGKNPETGGRKIFELIAQYRPPMSFCVYPTLYLSNHLYFLKPDSSWKQHKNILFSDIDSVHSTKRVVMVTPQHLLVTS